MMLAAAAAELEPELRSVTDAARRLDRFYIPTRYPNGLPGGIPAEAFDESDAAAAIADADLVVRACRVVLHGKEGGPSIPS